MRKSTKAWKDHYFFLMEVVKDFKTLTLHAIYARLGPLLKGSKHLKGLPI